MLTKDITMIQQPRHLAEGDGECPPLIPGSLRCYNMKYCPFAERSLLALVYKNVVFDIVNINLKTKPSWFLARASLGKVPTFERSDGDTITESLVTMEYLDEVYPDPPLFPKDSWKKAQDKVLVEIFNAKIVPHLNKTIYTKPAEINDIIEGCAQEMNYFETELGKRKTKFFSGNNPGYIDLALWPWFERLPVLAHMCTAKALTENHPKLIKWMSDMHDVPGIKPVIIPTDEHFAFVSTIHRGERNYDVAFSG